MKKISSTLLSLILCIGFSQAQEYFTITRSRVDIKVNKDASLDIDETINVRYTEKRHGIIRLIPYKYRIGSLPAGTEQADRQLTSGDHIRTIVENIKVEGWKYEVKNDGDYKAVKIGSADKYVEGDQQYVIHYRILNAINFFKEHSELYFNIVGDKWQTTIDAVDFSVSLHAPLPDSPQHFVATGTFGSTGNHTTTRWVNNQVFSGSTTRQLSNFEGVTLGIKFPKDFLVRPDYRFRGIYWLLLPLLVFAVTHLAWRRWGKDDEVTVRTEFYPPQNISPSVSGYIIDDRFNRRDLTALVPYWGAGGYLQVNETEKSSLLGLIKSKEYEFIKLKELPVETMNFERTLFNGIFQTGDRVMLNDLKDVLYKTMSAAQRQLESEVNKNDYYVKGSKGLGSLFIIIGIGFGIFGFNATGGGWNENMWKGIALFASGLIVLIYGLFMTKKTKKGTELYQQLLGFREFIRSVERDRLKEFLKQDEHYFDKILPYAIVFNVADTWKDKLEGLEIPPPTWYSGNYTHFNTGNFMHSLNNSMNTMSTTFYSAPSGSGSSGGSFSGGGSSGGGFGGGGGSSW